MQLFKCLLCTGVVLSCAAASGAELTVTERDSFIQITTINLGSVGGFESTTDLAAPFDEAVDPPTISWEEPGGDVNFGDYAASHSFTITASGFVGSGSVTGAVQSGGTGGGPQIAARAETAIVFTPTEDTSFRINGTFVGVDTTNQFDPRTTVSLQPRLAPLIFDNQVNPTPWIGLLEGGREYRLLMFSAINVNGNAPDFDTANFDYTFEIIPDSDGDGLLDINDNCIDAANADQRDVDGDGIGSLCDADFNQDCTVNVIDLGLLRANFFSSNDNIDMNGDGVVNVIELGLIRTAFFGTPGPSGIDGNLCQAGQQ